MLQEVNYLDELFLSTDIFGYLGPMGIVVGGYFVSRKSPVLAVLWFVMECLMAMQYFTLIDATPGYWWHAIILVFGGLFTCVLGAAD